MTCTRARYTAIKLTINQQHLSSEFKKYTDACSKIASEQSFGFIAPKLKRSSNVRHGLYDECNCFQYQALQNWVSDGSGTQNQPKNGFEAS